MTNKSSHGCRICWPNSRRKIDSGAVVKRAITSIAALTMSLASPAFSTPEYVSSVIEYPEEFAKRGAFGRDDLSIRTADVSGDGKKDILGVGWSEANGREILIYEQQDDGQFLNKPDQRISVNKEVVAYTIADVRATDGDEIIFLTGSSVYSYSTKIQSYSGNIEKLFDWPLIKSTPNDKRTYGLGPLKDINGDNRPDFVLPADGHYGVFLATEENGYKFIGKVPKAFEDERKTDSQYVSAFQFLVAERPYRDISSLSKKEKQRIGQNQGGILNRRNWISVVQVADMDGDKHADFVYLDDVAPMANESSRKSSVEKDNSKRLNISSQPLSGQISSRPDKEFKVSMKRNIETIRVEDLNDDQLEDIYIKTTRGSAEKTYSFFLNNDGEFDFEHADQVIKINGIGMEEELVDIDDDGLPELCITSFNFASLSALGTGDIKDIAIDRSTFIYKNRYSERNAEGAGSRNIFSRSADSKMESRMSADTLVNASSIEAIVSSFTPPHYINDANSDKLMDMALVDQNGTFSLHSINKEAKVDSDTLWEFVPQNAIYGVDDYELNADDFTDFILRHEESITVLVSK